MTDQAKINAEIERLRPVREAVVRRVETTFAICEEIAKREMEGSAANMVSDEDEANAEALHQVAHAPDQPAIDISSEAVAAWIADKRQTNVGGEWWNADMMEALVADRDRNRQELFQSRKFWSDELSHAAGQIKTLHRERVDLCAEVDQADAEIEMLRADINTAIARAEKAEAALDKLSDGE